MKSAPYLPVTVLLVNVFGALSYGVLPQQPKVLTQLDSMIHHCFRTICKDWMAECHWFCDTIPNQTTKMRCMECLSRRGWHCFKCFEM